MARSAFFKSIIFLIVSASIIGTINGQRTTTTESPIGTTTLPDATVGGKIGNPGALIRFSMQALDAIYTDALSKISQAIKSMVIPDVIVPIAGGMLTIKSARVTDAKFANFERQMLPPNKIRSRLSGGRIVSIGEWQYKPISGEVRQLASGIFRTIVVNPELNITNQVSRIWDAKPTVQTTQCKANLAQFRVEIEGFGDNTTVIDQCQNLLCQRIRAYFEEAVCNAARNYIKEVINQRLATFPTRTNLGGSGNRFVLDYGLLNGEPKVNEQFIQAYLEGRVLSRGTGSIPFYANDLALLEDRRRMVSFSLSDYVFNTLFYQAYNQQFQFSAIELLSESNSVVKDLLRMNCASPEARRAYKAPWGMRQGQAPLCLGTIFENSAVGKYPPGALGDLVFKSNQRPVQVIVRQPPQKSCFHIATACVDAYGPVGADGKREFLGRAHIVNMRGEFIPKLNATTPSCYCVTGAANITNLQLTPCPPPFRQAQTLNEQQLADFGRLSGPVLTEIFNAFMNRYAQFPVPLVDGYGCASPDFRWTERTMQVDCDVRVTSDAIPVRSKG